MAEPSSAPLCKEGWYLSEEGIEACTNSSGKVNTHDIILIALNTDLRNIGRKFLPVDINGGKVEKVSAATQGPHQEQCHPGDWIVIKKHVWKTCFEPRLKGPFQVILTTNTTVKCAGIPNWIHGSHTKRVSNPEEVPVVYDPGRRALVTAHQLRDYPDH